MKKIEAVNWTPEGTTTVTFEGGYRLQIYDDSPKFESYTLWNGGHLIVV
jgi:hypothetical protein